MEDAIITMLNITRLILFLMFFKFFRCQNTPVFRVHGENLNSETGSTISLNCDIDGVGDDMQYNVRWIKDTVISDGTQLLTDDSRITIAKFQSGASPIRVVYRLTILSSAPEHTGAYTCQLVYTTDNGFTFVSDSMSLYVFVLDKFPVCSITVNNVESSNNVPIEVNSDVQFSCGTTLKDPLYSLMWYYSEHTELPGRLELLEGSINTRQGTFEQSAISLQITDLYNRTTFFCVIWNKENARINYGCAIGPLEIVPSTRPSVVPETSRTAPLDTSLKITRNNNLNTKSATEPPLASKAATVQSITPVGNTKSNKAVISGPTTSKLATDNVKPTLDPGGQGTLHVVYTFPPWVWVIILVGTIAFILSCIVFIAILAKWKNKPETRVHDTAAAKERNHANGNI